MVCKFCGAEMLENSKFCMKCGRGKDGKTDPAKKKKAAVQFEKDISPICRRFSKTLDNNRELDPTYAEYIKALDESKSAKQKTVPLIILPLSITAILVAVFAVLIPGLNFDNENFRWIVKGKALSLVLCSSTAFFPYFPMCKFFASFYEERTFFTVGDLRNTVISGVICSVAMTFILAFLNGMFGSAFVPVCIILAVLLVIFAVILIIRWITASGSRSDFLSKQAKIEKLREAYESKFAAEIRTYREKYKDILSEEELDKCVADAKSSQARNDLKEISDAMNKIVR